MKSKIIDKDVLFDKIVESTIKCNLFLGDDVKLRLNELKDLETNQRAINIIEQLNENMNVAKEKKIPLCQDTGIVVAFVKIGNKVSIDFDLNSLINEAIANAYEIGNLRKSVVKDPLFKRENTLTNTPVVIHYDYVFGDDFEILIAPKGAGSENMSTLKMLNPTSNKKDVINYIVDVVKNAKGKPCPPIILGIGIGGTFEKAALEAKKACLMDVGSRNEIEFYSKMELELVEILNKTNIGPMGLGGKSTCLDVHIRTFSSHLASMCVAINIQCHMARHAKVMI